MTSQGCCAIIQTKLVTIALAFTFTRMKTLVATLPFFLACLLLEMRNALLANGLKEFSRGKLTDSWEHLPLFREAAYSGAKKQTASNTKDTASYVAERFHGMVSRSTNPRQFLQESKAQVPSKMQRVDEGSDYTRKRRSLSDTRTETTIRPITCAVDEYQCLSGVCIPLASVCNGRSDCSDGSDESGCATPSACTGQFKCDSNLCLPLAKVCDGVRNCQDGTDERYCANTLKVTNLAALPLTGGASVSLRWTPVSHKPLNVTIIGSRISYRAASLHSIPVSDVWRAKDAKTLSYYLVTDLQPCSEYEFKVQVLLLGMQPGPFSDTIKVKTTSVTTSPPRNIQHVSKGTDRIQITWETPVTYCHAVTSYKIYYKEDTQLKFQSVVTGNVHSYLLTGLSPSIIYDIKLQAHSTEDGDGQFSVLQSVTISIFRPTGPVTNLRATSKNKTEVVLAWGTPQSGIGTITAPQGYNVYESSSSGLLFLAKTVRHNYTVTGLLSDTEYTFIVKAYNSKGEGPGAAVMVKTNGAESAPRDVKAVPYNSSAVNLTWQEPIPTPTQEEMYYIYYGTVQNGVSSVPVGSTPATSYTVGNLQQSVVYVFQVSLGLTGQRSETVNSGTKPDHDYQPVHSLKAVVVNASSIVLTWEKPPDIENPSVIKGYQITMSYTADGRHKMELLKATMTSSTFRFLDFNTRYTFEVRIRFSKDNSLGPPVHVIKRTDAFTAPVGHLTAKVGYNSVVLYWSAPGTIRPRAMKHYLIKWNCTGCYYSQRSGDQACPRTNCTIPNLRRGYRYSFSVQAITDFGPGEISMISVLISRYFGKVRNLQASVDDDYNMTITWDPPLKLDAKDIKYYVVRWCIVNDGPYSYCYSYNSIHVIKTSYKLNVMAGSTYRINVYDITSSGSGYWSNLLKAVPPLNLKVGSAYAYQSGLEVYLSWYRVYTSGPVQYEVRWRCMTTGSSSCYYYYRHYWNTRVVNSTSFSVNVTYYGTAYEFEITVITSHGRGTPYKLTQYVPPLNGVPKDFSCQVTANSTVLTCHWSPPTDFNPAGFYYYWLRYKCDDCQYSYFHYKQISGINTTSTNVSVSRGAQWTVMLRVYTRYGYGKYAQVKLVTMAVVNPVVDLNAKLDSSTKGLVHLTWKASPGSSDIQNYLVITECDHCGFINTTRTITSQPKLDLKLPCGNTYVFTVKAQTKRGISGGSKVYLEIKPSVGAVTNLMVNFIGGGEDTNGTDWSKELEKGFLLTWNAPHDVKTSDIKFYEIIVRNQNKGQLVTLTKTDAKSTNWTMKRKDYIDGLMPGQSYVFQVRCSTLCGFGTNSTTVGFYHDTTRPTQSTTPWTHPSNCRSYEYKCHNGICIYMWDVCDGSDDCGDNSDEGWFCELLSSSSPSLAPPSAVVTYPSATYTSQLSSAASVTATKSPLYPSPTSYTSSATVTYASSTKKPFSSSPQSHSSDHIDRPFPYWAVATTAAAGAIIVFLVVYIVLKKCKKDRRTTLKYLQADYPQDMEESISEGDTPMLLENFTDDEILIRA